MSRIALSPLRIISLVAVAALVFLLDQLTKSWVASNLVSHEVRQLIDGFVRLRYTENTGASFGLLQGWTGALSIASIAIIAAIVLSVSRVGASSPWMTIGLGLVLGGAFGNLADRLTLGYVRDFVEVYNPHITMANRIYTFPVFNVADSAITVGVILVMAVLLFGGHPHEAPARVERPENEDVKPYVRAGSTQE